MLWNFEEISNMLLKEKRSILLDGKWGIERESLRTTYSGKLALTDHPPAFGSKLKNPEITTDFSESQIELITPPFNSVEETHGYLKKLQEKVENELKDELLWPISMPPILPDEEKIPIAKFDASPEGSEKETYRLGLAARYGKKMQIISGIHFNFSFGSELLDTLHKQFGQNIEKRIFTDNIYFAMARNFLRYRWLLIYLFGASPSIDPTYFPVMQREIKIIKKCCPECCSHIYSYEKYATSLRVSRFGYSNSVQGKYSVSLNSLADYIKGIRKLLSTKSDKFARIGIFRDGRQIQLNDNILQKESEFYSPIRLKQVTANGESQLDALEKQGVKYAEVRILDLNPFDKTGISINQMLFLQVFMLFCLFEQSNFIYEKDLEVINKNHHLVALTGRKQKLKLYPNESGIVSLKEWGNEIFNKLNFIADLVDKGIDSSKYKECVASEYRKLHDTSLLPSSRIQQEMKEKGERHFEFGLRIALDHKYQEKPIPIGSLVRTL